MQQSVDGNLLLNLFPIQVTLFQDFLLEISVLKMEVRHVAALESRLIENT